MFINYGRILNYLVLFDFADSTIYLQIEKDEGLPDKICYRCSEQANISYLFRKLCESSDSTLRELTKQYELQGELLTGRNKDIAIPKDISLEQNVLHQTNEIEIGNLFL